MTRRIALAFVLGALGWTIVVAGITHVTLGRATASLQDCRDTIQTLLPRANPARIGPTT